MNNINVGSFSWSRFEFALLMLEKKEKGQLTLPELLGILQVLFPEENPIKVLSTLREYLKLQ